jgi:hypothetical protein
MIRIGIRSFASGTALDPAAQAFITAAGITNGTQQAAIDTLVTSLKTYSLWDKLRACYPFVGGTASSHKFNLKNPVDTNAGFRLVFYGGWTHNANGVLAGVNGYADTFFNPVAQGVSLSSLTLCMYHRNTISGAFSPYFGNGQTSSPANYTCLVFVNKEAGLIAAKAEYAPSGIVTAYAGLKTISVNGSRSATFYKNGTSQGSTTQTGSYQNTTFYVSAINNGSGAYNIGVPAQVAFAVVADGFSATDVSNFYTIVQAFQTTLNRQV